MAQSTLIQNIQNLVSSSILSESDLADAVNTKLAPLGVSLNAEASEPAKSKAKAPKAKAAKAKAAKTTRKKRQAVEYPDGRSNVHALLLAVSNCGEDGGKASDIRSQLEALDHKLSTGVFNTTKTVLKKNKGLLKSKGTNRDQVISLTVKGKKALAEFENATNAPASDESEETSQDSE